jgi:hypothetical protein
VVTPAHIKVTYSGVFGDGNNPAEIWSWSVNIDGGSDFSPQPSQAAAARSMYATHLQGLFLPDCTLTRTRVAYLDAGGRVRRGVQGEYDQEDDLTNVSGNANGSLRYPLQTATCVSLDSDRAGATGKGRVFLPYTHFPIQGDWRLAAADARTIATAFGSFLSEFDGVGATQPQGPNILGTPVVVSGGGAGGVGHLSPIRRVRVGRVLDTMRSRRNAMLEGYEVYAIPTS